MEFQFVFKVFKWLKGLIVRGISFEKQGFSANVQNRMIFSGDGKYLKRIQFSPGGKKIRAWKWLFQPKMAD